MLRVRRNAKSSDISTIVCKLKIRQFIGVVVRFFLIFHNRKHNNRHWTVFPRPSTNPFGDTSLWGLARSTATPPPVIHSRVYRHYAKGNVKKNLHFLVVFYSASVIPSNYSCWSTHPPKILTNKMIQWLECRVCCRSEFSYKIQRSIFSFQQDHHKIEVHYRVSKYRRDGCHQKECCRCSESQTESQTDTQTDSQQNN